MTDQICTKCSNWCKSVHEASITSEGLQGSCEHAGYCSAMRLQHMIDNANDIWLLEDESDGAQYVANSIGYIA